MLHPRAAARDCGAFVHVTDAALLVLQDMKTFRTKACKQAFGRLSSQASQSTNGRVAAPLSQPSAWA
jgi:hypothetical protein